MGQDLNERRPARRRAVDRTCSRRSWLDRELDRRMTRAEGARVRNQPLTVGRLRELLSEFHESDTVLVGDEGDLLYRVNVNRRESIRGKVVVIEAGERYCVRRRAERGPID